jgi:hypothetical protein
MIKAGEELLRLQAENIRLKEGIKQAREEIDDLYRYYDESYVTGNNDSMFKCDEVLAILDKLIVESE